MCGIVGYLGKAGAPCAVGGRLLAMLGALSLRGPDSAGVAVWGSAVAGLKVRVKTAAGLVGFEAASGDPGQLARQIEAREPGAEVVSMGRRLEIVKQVGRPDDLQAAFGVSGLIGTHGLGHTRLSTESRIDLSHSQPFWAQGTPDLAVGAQRPYHQLPPPAPHVRAGRHALLYRKRLRDHRDLPRQEARPTAASPQTTMVPRCIMKPLT
jgi:hypothetical protein